MTTLQQQAKALGDPTRHAIFRHIADAGDGVDVATLTERLGLNHNAIRQHLAKLVEAGLIVESVAPATGRGRPRYLYRPDPSVDSRWGVVGPYERLSRLLAEIVRTGDSPVEVGRRAVEQERQGAAGTGTDPIDVLAEQMARSGFDPQVRRNGDEAEIILRTCPFSSAAEIDPETICNLHLGMARGVSELVDRLVIDRLVAHDPHQAHCELRCHLEPAPAG